MVVANQDPSSKKSTPSSIIKPATATKVVVKKPTSGFSAFSAFVVAHGAEDEDHDGHNIVVEVVRKSEVDKYLQLPALPTTRNGRDTCPLEWWKMHSHELPCLAKMARQFLALPASSAGVERRFSAVGYT